MAMHWSCIFTVSLTFILHLGCNVSDSVANRAVKVVLGCWSDARGLGYGVIGCVWVWVQFYIDERYVQQ